MSMTNKIKSRFNIDTISMLVMLMIFIIAMFLSAIVFSFNHYIEKVEIIVESNTQNSQKMLLYSQLTEVARARTRLSSLILNTYDPFEQDELNMQLESHSSTFSQLRALLLALPMTEKEKSVLLVDMPKIVSLILPAQRRSVELSMNGDVIDRQEAMDILHRIVLPGQQKMISSFHQLISMQQKDIAEAQEVSQISLSEIKKQVLLLIVSAFFITTLLLFRVITRIRRIQLRLKMMNETLEIAVYERTRELREAMQKAETISVTDSLTGLYNRLKIDETLISEINRVSRYKDELSIILFDIDNFKNINDTYGHLIGDTVLTKVANIVTLRIRDVDIAGRWGGEEFVIICPKTDLQGAMELAEELCVSMSNYEFDQVGNVTSSFGVAGFLIGENVDSLLKRADEALYSAKNAGRNRVNIATNPQS